MVLRKNVFACLFNFHDILGLSHHEQVCFITFASVKLYRLKTLTSCIAQLLIQAHKFYCFHPCLHISFKYVWDAGGSISRKVASLNILVNDVINLLYTDGLEKF